jgi:hypothetical protein
MSKVGFVLTQMAWNEESRFCPDWNSLDRRKSVLAELEWLGMEKVSCGLTWNVLEWRKSGLACLEWPGIRKSVLA